MDPRIALAPDASWWNSDDSVSTSPTLPCTPIRDTRNADTRNVRALTPIAIGAGPKSSSTADSAGPNASEKLSIVPDSAFAAARSRSGTIDGVTAVTAG